MKSISRRSFVAASAAVAAAALAPAATLADDSREANPAEDLTFEEVDGVVAITGYVGQAEEVVVPRSINGTLVGMIWDNAFENKSALFRVVLPKGVFYIGDSAFAGCISLEEVALPERLVHIGAHAFDGCSFLEEVELPDSLAEIGEYAFQGTWITELDLPDGLTALGDCALAGCQKLAAVDLPERLASIGKRAFEGDVALEDVELPDSLISIGEYAFEGTALVRVVIPDGVASVPRGAFPEGCELVRADDTAVEAVHLDDTTGLLIVEFGSYPQSGAEPDPIEWLVLGRREDGASLLPWSMIRSMSESASASPRALRAEHGHRAHAHPAGYRPDDLA